MTLAEDLGGGVPIGAMLCNDRVADGFEPGAHATTFGGNPLVCAVANTVLSVVEKEGLVERARRNLFCAGVRKHGRGNSRLLGSSGSRSHARCWRGCDGLTR